MSALVSLLTLNGNATVDEVASVLAHTTDSPIAPRFIIKALRVATSSNNVRVMTLLLDHHDQPIVDDSDPLVCVAARSGHVEALEVLFARGFSVNARDSFGTTALVFACQDRKLAAFEWLLAHGASTGDKATRDLLLVDAVGDGFSASASVELLSVLLRENLCDDINDPELGLLARTRSADAAALLLAHGASATQSFSANDSVPLDWCGNDGALTRLLLRHGAGADRRALNRAMLRWWVGSVCVDALDALLDAGGDPNSIDEETGDSVLMRTSPDLFTRLVAAGADVKYVNPLSGESVWLRVAGNCLLGCADVVGMLVRTQAIDEEEPDVLVVDSAGFSLLNLCCHGVESIDFIRRLLSRGADVNLSSTDGDTALHGACEAHNLPLIQLLLAHGANIHAINGRDETPAHCVLVNRSRSRNPGDVVPILRCLINAGVDVDALDLKGATILHLAAANCSDVRAVEAILRASSRRIDHESALFGTPLHCAARVGNVPVGRALIEAGATVDVHPPPLNLAAVTNNADFVEFLVRECGVAVDCADNSFTALHVVCIHHGEEQFPIDAVAVLLVHGADLSRAIALSNRNEASLEEHLELWFRTTCEWSAGGIAAAIGKLRVVAVRRRGADIAIALQQLELPAHQTVLILEQALASVAAMPYALLWQLATCVKHWRDRIQCR